MLVAAALTVATSTFAQAPAPTYQDLFARGSEAYSAADWPRCAEVFAKAAESATDDRRAARSYFAAAACAAAKGDADAAFSLLDKAAAKGYRDRERAAENPKLGPLRQDPRWQAFFAGVQARAAAHDAEVNAELARLYHEDQADRREGPNAKIDWTAVSRRDAERRRKVLEIVERGGAREADDYYHAAMVFQHGETPEDYDRAHQWCLEALKLDSEHPSARWLAAASKDRALMWRGKPQLYGTQFKKVDGEWILWEVDPAITDEERAKWDVPPLAVAKKRAEELNTGQ
jgi:hypothetical protein